MTTGGAIVFDLDGTLVDSAPDIHAAVNEVLAEDRLPPLPLDQVKSFIGNGMRVLLAKSLAAHGLPAEGDGLDRAIDRFAPVYSASVTRTLPYPGVPEALDILAVRHPLALCTNKPMAATRSLLAHLGWGARFAAIVAGDSLPARKPDPAPLSQAVARAGGGPALYVGDSEVDAETARAAGLPFLLFEGGYRHRSVADLAPAASFTRFAALPDLVADICARHLPPAEG
ncbi:phosphoglycolate phosphatase [Frigidibacter oleivorans]|uniref:phosphoglycolate phosphatase n=1 Tax=Frigidibacter oleivorans TaxID=2487129 RepID=UPI000F8D544F|nr:phosphoglycolate phosphatase [Frigidibacter oleivorans]